MDYNLLSIFAMTITALLITFHYFLRKPITNNSRKLPPEADGAWPVIGHLVTLARASKPLHKTLTNMAEKYGSIFTIRIGIHRTLIVSSFKSAKECLTTNDRAFANRPKGIALDIMSYDYSVLGLSPYGPYWCQLRKIATLELFSNHRLKKLCHVWKSEISNGIEDLNESCGGVDSVTKVDMKKWFGEINMNVIFRLILGKRYAELCRDDKCRAALQDFVKLLMVFLVADAIPWLRWLDLGGYEKAMRRTAEELDQVLQEWVDEHKKNRASGETPLKESRDFMDVMLSVLDDEDSSRADTTIKATCMALLLGGIDTTSATLTWALSLLLNNKETLKKLQLELDEQVGRERQVEESDIKNLRYLQAVLKETMRLYPAAPLAMPHESTEDCTVGGYHVPARTRLVVNISKIHRDPNVWSDPDEFRPERFLTTHVGVDVRGQSLELIPFGSGRRMCPAVSLALQLAHLSLASLIHGFEISTVGGELVDMSVTDTDLINSKKLPLDVLVSPRLPSHQSVFI